MKKLLAFVFLFGNAALFGCLPKQYQKHKIRGDETCGHISL